MGESYVNKIAPIKLKITFAWKECLCKRGFWGNSAVWSKEKKHTVSVFYTNKSAGYEYDAVPQGFTFKKVFPNKSLSDFDVKDNITRNDVVDGLRKATKIFKKINLGL